MKAPNSILFIALLIMLSACKTSNLENFGIQHHQKHQRVYVNNNTSIQTSTSDAFMKSENTTDETEIEADEQNEYLIIPKDSIVVKKSREKKNNKPDKIYIRTGEKYKVKNIIIKDSLVQFQYYKNKKDTSYHQLIKTDIEKIKYSNGEIDIILNDSTPSISHGKMQEYLNRKTEPFGIISASASLLTIGFFIGLLILGGSGFITILLALTALVFGILSLNRFKHHRNKYKGKFFTYFGMAIPSIIIAFFLYFIIYMMFFF